MTDQQIQFYNTLPDCEKHIINVAALTATNIDVAEITSIVQKRHKVTQKQVNDCIESAIVQQLFQKKTGFYSVGKQKNAELSFIIYLYPKLSSYQAEWKVIEIFHKNFITGMM